MKRQEKPPTGAINQSEHTNFLNKVHNFEDSVLKYFYIFTFESTATLKSRDLVILQHMRTVYITPFELYRAVNT